METDSSNLPLTVKGIEKFLASPWVKGIGSAYAARLVERFGTNALRVLLEKPRLAEAVPGVGASRASAASESLKSLIYPVELLAFLYSCDVSDMFIERIFGKYRKRSEHIILTDPYAMVEDVWQLSFFTADKIGRNLAIATDDPRRLRAALVTVVKHFAENGHLFACIDEAVSHAADIAGVDESKIRVEIAPAVASGRLIESRGGLYLPVFYKAEKEGSERIVTLAAHKPDRTIKVGQLPRLDRSGHEYTPSQLQAIALALNSPVMVLTGGPGSGKTTVLRGIIDMLEKEGKKVTLCAPTGRAAKRMTALTGTEAMTIHRLLGYRQGEGYNTRLIDTDTLIIDEGSMMEQVLFNHLLEALRPGTQVILVGDVDQLPAIGAGDVLRDMIDSGAVAVARLDENFRQAAGSGIASAARAINSGEMPAATHDLMIIEENGSKKIHDKILSLITTELPAAKGLSPTDILVVTPQQIGSLGARQLNIDLQEQINPEGPALKRGATIMRLGDPVMQTTNSRERGVYNGECGRISAVDTEAFTLEVLFADGHRSTYHRDELGELTLAYATTVHKLQGSEVKNMILIVTSAHRPMLYRNLIYTGISRASELCIIIGEEEALRQAIANTPATTRNSNFKHRLRRH